MARREHGFSEIACEDFFIFIMLVGALGFLAPLVYQGVISNSSGAAFSAGHVEMYTVANPALLGKEYHSGLLFISENSEQNHVSWSLHSARFFNTGENATGWSLLLGWWPHSGQIFSPDPLLKHPETRLVARWQWFLDAEEVERLMAHFDANQSDKCLYSWMGLAGQTSASWALAIVQNVTAARPQLQCQPYWLPPHLRGARNLFAWPSNCLEVSE